MTPAQKSALEFLIGRALTYEEGIAIDAAIEPLRNDVAIAEILSQGRTKIVKTPIGDKDVLRVLGLQIGTAFLDAIYTNPLFKYALPDLERNDLDVSDSHVIDAINAAVPGVLTVEQAESIKGLARVPDPIHYNAVSDCLNAVIE